MAVTLFVMAILLKRIIMEIIPAINAKDWREAKKKIKAVESYTDWIQINIMDGKFAPFETWNQPKKIKELGTSLKIEIHLMVANPFRLMDDWLKVGCDRITVNWESLKLNPQEQLAKIIVKAKKSQCEIAVAVMPDSPWRGCEPFFAQLDRIVLMGEDLRKIGMSFQEKKIIARISEIKKAHPNIIIGIDSGIRLGTTIENLAAAGVQAIILGSAIFEEKNPAKALQGIQERVK